MKIIKQREKVERKWYERLYQRADDPAYIKYGCFCGGYGFNCDSKGNVILENEMQEENYKYCIEHPEEYLDLGVEEFTNKYTEPAIGICECCEREVVLTSNTNECECGEVYNMFGQHLAPRKEWGWCGDMEDDDYCPSATNGDYSPSNPWDAPGMSIRDFI